jgi:hypothetical protein
MKRSSLQQESNIRQKLAWYEARDLLLGENNMERDVKKALELAAVCGYPEVVWLLKLFVGRDVRTAEDAKLVFVELGDTKALCFAALLGRSPNRRCVEEAAEKGFALAQAKMTEIFFSHSGWAEKAAAQGERDGFFQVHTKKKFVFFAR